MSTESCLIEQPVVTTFELVIFHLDNASGVIALVGEQTPRIAADRWLIQDPDTPLTRALRDLEETGAIAEVTGKWLEFDLSGPGARTLLAHTLNVDEVFEKRSVARVTLFDCPAVLRKAGDHFCICVERSYRDALLEAVALIARCRAADTGSAA